MSKRDIILIKSINISNQHNYILGQNHEFNVVHKIINVYQFKISNPSHKREILVGS